MTSPPIIPGSEASAKFIAQLTRGGTREDEIARLRRLGVEIPQEAELGRLWETRQGRRLQTAVLRRSTAPKPERRELTPKQLQAEAVERRADRKYREKLEKRASGWIRGADEEGRQYRTIPDDVWRAAKDLRSTTSSAAWRYHAKRLRNKAAVGAIWRAAFEPYDADDPGITRRNFSDDRARCLLALGYSLAALAKHTSRKGPWGKVVRGIPLTAFQWLLSYPDGSRAPFRTTLTGRHRGPDSRSEGGQLGYLRTLEQSGLIARSQQWYPDAAAWELGPERTVLIRGVLTQVAFQMNRYWLVTDTPPRSGEHRDHVIELIRQGWECLDALPKRWRPKRPGRPGPRTPVHGETGEISVYSTAGPPPD